MGSNTSQVPEEPSTVTKDEAFKKLKPCCACPDTKRARDECIILQGEENCLALINKHKKCMRDHGFEI